MRRTARLLGPLLLLVAGAGAGAEPPGGAWSGSIQPADGDVIELSLVLELSDEGLWGGELTAPALGADSTPLEELSVSSEIIRFSAPALPGAPSFVGTFSGDRSAIRGTAYRDPPAAPPATDIYLFGLELGGPIWKLGTPINITDRDGYDNQPRFLPDSSGLLYTSIRDGQADIYRYDLGTRRIAQVTATAQSEYSPTPLPSADGFSTVRVEDDGTQRLWSFDMDGGAPMLVLESIQPVGYHGWLDEHRLGLFVLGSPPSLQVADVELQSAQTVAESIGRSIHRTPDGGAVSFVYKESETAWWIDRIELDGGQRRSLIATRDGSEDFVWTPDGRLLMGAGSDLFAATSDRKRPSWMRVADLSGYGIAGITRLAISADSRWLAVVGERAAAGPPPERIASPFELKPSN